MSEQIITEVYGAFAGGINHDGCSRIMGHIGMAVSSGLTTYHLLIQSSGGTVEDGIALYNFLRHVPIRIITYNVGGVQSIAVAPYLAGQIRRCSPSAIFMIHRSGLVLQGPINANQFFERGAYLNLSDKNADSILRAHITMPDDKWDAHRDGDLVITAEDALKFGLVHEIAEFVPPPGSRLVGI